MRMQNRNGFTLIEILMVMVLVALLVSTILVGGNSWIMSSSLENSAAKISECLSLALTTAIREQKEVEIVYDLEENRVYFHIPSNENNENTLDESDVDLPYQGLSMIYLPSGIRFKDIQVGTVTWDEGGAVKLKVQPWGTTSDHMIHLINENDQEFTIEFLGLTSTVKFYEGYHEYELEPLEQAN